MRKNSEHTLGRTHQALGRRSRNINLTKVLGGILFLALLHSAIPASGAPDPGRYGVTMKWDRSVDPAVTAYRVHVGVASGKFTNSVAVGNVTTNTVGGLVNGVTYYFAVTAVGAGGLESVMSNEIKYLRVLPTIQIRVVPKRQIVLTVKGLAGTNYNILASQNLITWTNIGNVTLGASGSSDFTDLGSTNYPKRFYRAQQKP